MPKDNIEIPPKDEEELELEKLVFGDLEGFENNLKKVDNLFDYSDEDEIVNEEVVDDIDSDNELDNLQDHELFYLDDGIEQDEENDSMDIDSESEEEDFDDDENAWQDSDDEKLDISLTSSDRLKKLRKTEQDSNISGRSYVIRLRSQFERIYPRPEWIEKIDNEEELSSDEEVDEDEDEESNAQADTKSLLNVLKNTQQFITTKQLKLISPNKLSISRLKDANYQRRAKSAIQSISFHPQYPVLLTGGFDKTVRIYQIDGKSNNFITSFFLKNCPIYNCQFSPLKDETIIYVAGRRKYMNKINFNNGDIEKISRLFGHEKTQKSFESFKISKFGNYIGLIGNNGWCNILNGKTGQWINGFKIEGTIIDFDFTNDEKIIIIVNTYGEVTEFDLENNKVLRKWQDDGGIGITKLKIGGVKNKWIAIGSNNGMVNVYDRNNITSDRPKPIKTIENLITSISDLSFNNDGQLLCISSRAKRDALKLVHLPSCSVYSNWPTSGTPLGKVTSVCFSPNNEMLAIGNESGKVTLWRLNHY
ncbi:unnamed protein product [Candida verbasci]|uniref:U3 small nucleolar RNA-associated protein 18 n=1 Tax=Candida verbasci TaxID=1227364 RepID=A0A9W4U041_9ASCO|nr:unnamed protein product [Candida verbasci]